MSSPCTVCSHEQSAAIDELLRGGTTARAVSTGYDLGYHAVARHARNHLTRARKPASNGESADDPMTELLAHLRIRALGGQDAAAREYRLLLGQLEARNGTAPPRDLATEPEWLAFRNVMLAALDPFPEARLAIAQALADAGLG